MCKVTRHPFEDLIGPPKNSTRHPFTGEILGKITRQMPNFRHILSKKHQIFLEKVAPVPEMAQNRNYLAKICQNRYSHVPRHPF